MKLKPVKAIEPNFYHSILFTLLYFLFIMGCQSPAKKDSYKNVSLAYIEKGRKLAEIHCQLCHQLPNPALLDAKTWETGALPAMGPLLGIFNYKGQPYTYRGDSQMRGPGYFASNPKVSLEEWESLVAYYTATSPARLPDQDERKKISMKLPLFQVLRPKLDYKNAQSCFVKIREDQKATLVVSDALTLKTYFLDSHLRPIDSLATDGPLVNIDFTREGEAIACNVGELMPNIDAGGSGLRMRQKSGKWEVDDTPILSGLRRPLQILRYDINDDGKTDYLVCEFGQMQGGLSWMENEGQNQYEKHTISELPGALQAYPFDGNHDGKTDIMALFTQGKEGIFLYTNMGNGSFEEEELLRFPAVYGSSSFELADFNGDGLPDILYTCGDNADYTPILKPYHGVYIYLNKGENRFEKAFFYPIYGCYKAMARDFDKDGDLDLATIAYYADFAAQPEEGFIYLENNGDLRFSPYSSPKLEAGRWITMDVGDIDYDDWPDIVLGNFVQPSKFTHPRTNWANASPVMILKNRGL